MKVHPDITKEYPKIAKKLKVVAKKVGLDKIDYKKLYKVTKLGAKNASPYGYPDAYTVITGYIYLTGDGEQVTLYVNSNSKWFMTSGILSCKKKGKDLLIETSNSYYKLS